MYWYIALTLHFILFFWASYNVLYYGVKPSKSLSWLLITFFFPFFGVLIFILFGINRRKIKYFELKETKKRKRFIKNTSFESENSSSDILKSTKASKISNLIFSNIGITVRDCNDVKILKNGKEAFHSIFKAIEKAEQFIHLQYYIIEEGEILNKLVDLLLKKRKENIEVRILYDIIGSYYFPKKIKQQLKDAGVQIYPETKLHYGSFLFTINYRNHRKICVIDNKVGFTGGVNITDEYIIDDEHLGIWQDAHVQLTGTSVSDLHFSFLKDFYFATDENLTEKEKYCKPFSSEVSKKVQIVSSGPDYEQSVVMQQYLSFINLAEKSICVMNPYFVPTFSILEAFKIAALSGIEVSLVLPKKSDSKIATYSMYSYFESLLNAGVDIYLRDDFSHSKVIFIDDEITSIGSTNFDCRSFEHNYELNAIIYDEKVTSEVRDEFNKRKDLAHKINLSEFKKRSKTHKTLERLCRFLSPLL
jgi:cardiolipin synthase